MRKTFTGILGCIATCQNCGWIQESKNALGLAAQHHDRAGHTVTVEQVIYVQYGEKVD